MFYFQACAPLNILDYNAVGDAVYIPSDSSYRLTEDT